MLHPQGPPFPPPFTLRSMKQVEIASPQWMYEVSHPSGGSLVGDSVPGLGLGVPGVGLGVAGSEVLASVVGGIVVPGLGLNVPGVGLGVVGSEVLSSVVGGIVDGDGVLGVGTVVIGVGFGEKLIDSTSNRSNSLWLKYKNPLGSQRSTILTGPYETAFDSHTYSRASTSKNASDPSEASNSRCHFPSNFARFASSGATTIVMNKNNESKNLMVPEKTKLRLSICGLASLRSTAPNEGK